MREYETVFITHPNQPEAQHKHLVERLGTMIDRHGGRIFFARDMGRRALAYPIGKQSKGLYTCLDYAAAGGAVNEIERNLRLDENVLRFLTVVRAEEVDVEARAAEVAARGEDAQPPPAEETAASGGKGEGAVAGGKAGGVTPGKTGEEA